MKKLNVLMAVMAVAVLASCGGTGSGKVAMKDVKDTISYSIGMGRAVRVYKDQLPYEIISSSQPLGISSYELSKIVPEIFRGSLPSIEEIESEL